MNPFWHSFALYTICIIECGAAPRVNSFCNMFILFLDLVDENKSKILNNRLKLEIGF